MEFTIVVKGKVPEKLKHYLELLLKFALDLLVLDGVKPENVTSALIWNDGGEDA